uniref:Transmembrane protein 255A n=1 Tax=Rhinopithecus bieti TaxID=61621 RepID=A0A2K6KH57_RHIBE
MHQSLTQQRSSDMSLPDSMGKSSGLSFGRRQQGVSALPDCHPTYYVCHIALQLGFGSFLGIIGSNLIENKRQMLVASIVFISFGVIAAFCCAIVDGVFAARHIVTKPLLVWCFPFRIWKPLYANRCHHYVPKTSQKEAEENPTLPALNCSVENTHPTVSYYAHPQVTSYNTYYHSPPHLPPYSAYDFQHSSVFPSSPPSGLSDEPQSASPSPSYMWSSSAPPRYSPPYYPPFEKPPPYSP